MPPALHELGEQINECMICDRRRLRRRLRGIRQRKDPSDHAVEAVRKAIADAHDRRKKRAERLLTPKYELELPVVDRREEILSLIREHQVVIVCGETGSGKTTQLPKMCLELGRGVDGMIGHTQPRRIAARAVASRVAQELGTSVGAGVGYKIRFSDQVSENTLIKVMTDGILLAETQSDRLFELYDTIIIDEAHERSLNIDFLLGYLKRILPKRPDLKVIITSATIDPQRFSDHFDGAPIIEVSGRTYPVEVRHRPLVTHEDEEDRDLQEGVLDALRELDRDAPGNVLIFMSGEREIRETAESLRRHWLPGVHQGEILPLYARLSTAEQQKVFKAHTGRRVIIATNVAETSLTVPGIRAVIDPGLARMSLYSPRQKIQRLPIEPVSQASAKQRAGRCGRIGPGVCVRLYSEEDFSGRPEHTTPELLRSNLASVILQMKALNLGEIQDFPFMDPPDGRMIRDGFDTLHELGAIDERDRLTSIGEKLARLPIDPRLGRMILAASDENCLREALIIVAALACQDPRERPMERRDEADEAHERFKDETSDFLLLLNIWRFYHTQSEKISRSQLRKACRQNFLSYLRMREWVDVHRQLRQLVRDMSLRLNSSDADPASIHRALLSGLLSNIAKKAEAHEYAGARGARIHIFPGSGLFQKNPKWIMASELVRTTRLYARTVAQIQPQWIERVGDHLIRKSHSDPHWDALKARVSAKESVSLFGLPIVKERSVHFGPIDPAQSRTLFIHHALVEGDMATDAPYMMHNRKLVHDLAVLEAKTRRHDLIRDAEERFEFFDQVLPRDVFSGQLLDKWRKGVEKRSPEILFLPQELVASEHVEDAAAEPHPDGLRVGESTLALEYRFEPGEQDDGVTLQTPADLLPQVDARRCEWIAPGPLEDKVEALIRSLPKQTRRLFAPAREFAERVAEDIDTNERSLLGAVADRLGRLAGVQILPEHFRLELLPEHLSMNFRVVDDSGHELGAGRDLLELRRSLGSGAARSVGFIEDEEHCRQGIVKWTFGDLRERVEIERAGATVQVFPTIVDDGDSVSIRLATTPELAERELPKGLRRLFALEVSSELNHRARELRHLDAIRLGFATMGDLRELDDAIRVLIADRAFLREDSIIMSSAAFERRLDIGWNSITEATDHVDLFLLSLVNAHQELELALERAHDRAPATAADIRDQFAHLLTPGFLLETPFVWLAQFPRYFSAASRRVGKAMDVGETRDQHNAAKVATWWNAYKETAERHRMQGECDANLAYFRWMIEEYRVMVHAEELGVATPVSMKRLNAQWARIRQ